MKTLNRSQVRQLDRRANEEYGLPTIVLMENAGRGLADKLVELGTAGPVAICCGKGNNAGDGFVLARHLDVRRLEVRVLVCGDPAALAGDARINFDCTARCGITIEVFSGHDGRRLDRCLEGAAWIVDALLGTGAMGEPRPPLDEVIDALNAQPAPKLAVDLPSGLDCDTGQAARHTVRAAHTCTFVAAKPGFLVPGAGEYVGQLHVLDIGIPHRLIEEVLGE
ncbi:MAG: NAD(P)H-hydrate epimerase [Pirellulales bacterium]